MAGERIFPDPERIATQADFARELKALRERSGLTIREIARAAGIAVATTGDYFSGRHLPSDPAQLTRILQVCGESDPARIERWTAAVVRARRPPGRRTEAPYRGLARFEPRDAQWFFGREDVTDLLVTLAAEPSPLPLMLVGPSGAGKSSLLRAGLLPRLERQAAAAPGRSGPVLVFEPTPTPAADLSARLAGFPAGAGPGADGDGGPDAGGDGGGGADGDGDIGAPLAVIVDQFESVFTRCADEAQRREFISAVCELARTGLVILALRADFYGHAMGYPGLAQALQSRQVLLGPMTAEQVGRAVTEPARLARVDVEEGLVGLLLADLAPQDGGPAGPDSTAGPDGTAAPDSTAGRQPDGAYQPGALPLLSHAMLATWEQSHGGKLTIADYLTSGRISGALNQTAETAYLSLPAAGQRQARRLFLRLVHVADGLPPSRATVALSELRDLGTGSGPGSGDGTGTGDGDEAGRVLATFVDRRLITVDAGTAQITHDALLSAWPRLRSWIEEGTEGLRLRRRITEGARAWDDAGREAAALWRGSQLAVARDWAADDDNRGSLNALAAAFVDASIAGEAARQHAERRRVRRLRGVITGLTAMVVVVCLLAVYAFDQRQAAVTAQDNASSREIAIEANQLREQDPALAAQLSVAAYRIARTPEATASLLGATDVPVLTRLEDSAGIVQAVAVSPARALLAAAGADGTLRLWDVANPGHAAPLATLAGPSVNPLYATAFSPDGKILAAAGAGMVVRLWDVTDPARPVAAGTLSGPASTIYSVAFSPDGHTLAAASADNTVRLWDVTDPARPRPLGPPLTGPTGYVHAVAFSADGRLLAAGSGNSIPGRHDDTVWIWDVTRPAHPVLAAGMPLKGPASLISGVAFSPDGQTLAASSQDHKVWLWKVARSGAATPAGTLTTATNWVDALAFSPDGTQLAAGTSEARLLVWNMATRALVAATPYPKPVTTVAWDGSGRLAVADADGTASIMTLPAPVLLTGNAPASVAYRPDGRVMAVGGTSIELWDTARRTLRATYPLPGGTSINALAFAPAGNILAAAYGDGRVQLLSGATLAPLSPPFPVTARGAAESVAYSPDGKTIVTGADDGSVRTWSVTDPARPRPLADVPDAGTYVYTVAYAPDGKTVAAASVNNLTRLWNVTDPARPVPDGAPLAGLQSYAIGLSFSPDSGLLGIGSADGTVRLWDVRDPARATPVGAPLAGPTGYVWSTAFSPDGHTLAAGSTDGTVWLWDVTDPARPSLVATLAGPASHVYSVAFSPSGSELAATSYEGTVHLWDARPAAARAAVCGNLGQPMTAADWASLVPGVPYRAPCT
jgi:WD40 repeat protein/transcriptional regulator with XRE-family HTH domain